MKDDTEIFVTLWVTLWMQIMYDVSQKRCTWCAVSISDVYGTGVKVYSKHGSDARNWFHKSTFWVSMEELLMLPFVRILR